MCRAGYQQEMGPRRDAQICVPGGNVLHSGAPIGVWVWHVSVVYASLDPRDVLRVHWCVCVLTGEVKYCIAKLFSGDVKFATALDY